MSHHPSPALPLPIIFSLFFSLLPHLPALLVLPDPGPATVQQLQPFHPNPSSPATIPSFPEQSAVAGCSLNLPVELLTAVKASCVGGKGESGRLRRIRCCPVLASWLYSAYSETALGRSTGIKAGQVTTTSYEMPLLPDDSETCVDGLEKAMRDKGVNLVRPNATCDVVYCFCGIRLHPLSCPQAFSVSKDGKLVGDETVKRLERDCSSENGRAVGYSGLAHCSKCLNSLYSLKNGHTTKENGTKSESRTSKMRSRDCELMGLTWLLKKNRDAYISTVTAVMRALMMMNTEGSDPQSCSLSAEGMPLAVDSVEINGQSSSAVPQFHPLVFLFSLSLLILCPNVLSYSF